MIAEDSGLSFITDNHSIGIGVAGFPNPYYLTDGAGSVRKFILTTCQRSLHTPALRHIRIRQFRPARIVPQPHG